MTTCSKSVRHLAYLHYLLSLVGQSLLINRRLRSATDSYRLILTVPVTHQLAILDFLIRCTSSLLRFRLSSSSILLFSLLRLPFSTFSPVSLFPDSETDAVKLDSRAGHSRADQARSTSSESSPTSRVGSQKTNRFNSQQTNLRTNSTKSNSDFYVNFFVSHPSISHRSDSIFHPIFPSRWSHYHALITSFRSRLSSFL